MKTTRLEKLYIGVLALIFALIVVHAPLSVGFGVLFPKYSLLIKSWKEILMVCVTPLAVIIIKRRHLWEELIHDTLFYIISGYVTLHFLLGFILYHGIEETTAGLAIDLRYILFFSLVYIAVRALPQYRRLLIKITIMGAGVVVGFACLQLFLPANILTHIGYGANTIAPYLTVDKNQSYIRVNSTLRGPNPLGAYAGMVLACIAAAGVRGKLQTKKRILIATAIATCSSVALWISYSRSSLVAGILAVLLVIAVAYQRRLFKKRIIISALAVCALVGILLATHAHTLVSNVLLHENPNGGSSVNSNQRHIQSLVNGVTAVLHQPIGSGIGSTGSASLEGNSPIIIENQYLFVAHETGWLGLLLFLALSIILYVRLWKKRSDWLALGIFASGIGLTLIGLLLPVWADDTVSIIWWGLAAIALAGGGYANKSTK